MTQTVTPTQPRRRYETIDIAKAIAIVLVVVGHFHNPAMPEGYDLAVKIIYLFHMPLFMFASGFLCIATWRALPYRTFVGRKFKRLMGPYFVTSLIIITIKMATQGVLPVENPVTWFSFVEILWLPSAGYFLWFIWALWWMMMIIPLFNTPRRRLGLLSASVILFFVNQNVTEIFCLNSFCRFLIYFSAGTVFADMSARLSRDGSLLRSMIPILLFAGLATALACGATENLGKAGTAVFELVAGLTGIAMALSVSTLWLRFMPGKILTATYSVASASYIIYLFHTTFEGFAKGVLSKLHIFGMEPRLVTAWAGAAIVIACGVVIPWLLATKVLNRSRLTALLFGLKYK